MGHWCQGSGQSDQHDVTSSVSHTPFTQEDEAILILTVLGQKRHLEDILRKTQQDVQALREDIQDCSRIMAEKYDTPNPPFKDLLKKERLKTRKAKKRLDE